MEYRHQQLRLELSKLNKTFADLGATLTGAAKEITSAGIAPGDKLVEQITSARKSFDAVRGSVHGFAVEMLVKPLPKPDELGTIAGIDALLGLAANAEENRSLILDERTQALATLARVLSIIHREHSDFRPLADCLAAAKALSDAIANTPWPNRHPEAQNLVGEKHPLTALLSLVVNRDVLEDDKWIQLEETVTVTYGKALSVAASRNKLTMSDGSKAAPVLQSAAKPAKPAEAPKAAAPVAAPASPAPVAAAVAPQPPVMTTPVVAPPLPPIASAVAPTPAPAAVSAPATIAMAPPATAGAAPAPAPQAAPVAVAEVPKPEPPKAEAPKPEPVKAVPVAVVEKKPAVAATPAPPVAVAVQTAPAVEAKVNSHIPAAAPVEEKRKEPRVVAPAQMPKPVEARVPAEARVEDKQIDPDDKKPVPAGAGAGPGAGANAGDRPQRWGFWRGNR